MSILFRILVALMLACSFAACSGSSEKKHEKGKIEQFTDRQADRIVHAIQDPINKAKTAAQEINAHNAAEQKEVEE